MSRMRLIIKIILWTIAVISVLIGGLYVYLRNADLNVYEEQIEGILTNAIGHEVDFNGPFELRFGRITTVAAENITLRNLDWTGNRDIVAIERVFISLRPWSFIFGPAVVDELAVEGLDVGLERDDSGAANWVPDKARTESEAEDESDGEFNPNAVVVKKLRMSSAHLSLEDPRRERPIDARIGTLTITPDADGILDIDLDGLINEFPLTAAGTIGTVENLIRGADVKTNINLGLGRLEFSAVGTFGDLRNLTGVYLETSLRGPAIENIIETLALPPFAAGAFDVNASISPESGGHHVNVEGNVGLIELFAGGNVSDLLEPEVVSLEYRFAGPESAYIASLFDVEDATRAAFDVNGGFRRDRQRFEFIDTNIELGRSRIGVDGWIRITGNVPDMDLTISATGPNLAVFDPFIDLDSIPAEPFDVSGRIQKDGDFWHFDDVDAEVGEIDIEARGTIGERGNPDNRIEFRATGPDVATVATIAGLDGVVPRPFDVTADLRSAAGGIRIESATGVFGEIRVDASGVLKVDSVLAGTELEVRARGPDLSDVVALQDVRNLPTGAFDIAGRLRIDPRRLRLEAFTATAGDLAATADGWLVRGSDPPQITFDVSVNGPDLAASLPYEPLVRLPGESFDVQGRIEMQGTELTFSDFDANVGNLQAYVDGNIDTTRFLESDNVEVAASAPDATVLRALSGFENLPDGAFTLSGRLETTDRTVRISDASVSLGEYRADIDGEMGRTRPYFGDDISIRASGPSLHELGMIFDYADMSYLPFSLVTVFDGTETGFATDVFRLEVGDSVLDGTMSADLSGDKPVLDARLTSTLLDFQHAQQVLAERDEDAAEPVSGARSGRVFSDEPLELGWLDAADVDFDLAADHIRLMTGEVSDFHVALELEDGRLTVDPIEFTQQRGTMSAALELLPQDTNYRLTMSLDIDDVRPPLLAAPGQAPMTVPPIDVEYTLTGHGNSLAEIMGSSDGYVFLFQEKGQVAMLGLQFMFTDLVSSVVRTINPLSTRRTYTNLDCGILDVDVEDGIATLKNVAIQTDRLTIVGSGEINLGNERLRLSVRTKPREGIGVSVGGVVNSFMRVRGTIKEPSIELDPTSSVTTTGAAVATGGLSLLARGLWDRLSAEADMCKSLPRTRREE